MVEDTLMVLKVYDTLLNKKVRFTPLTLGEVRMFVCGPTVYDYLHLGHARTYIPYDIMARYLTVRGNKVRFIVNITDIDEKIFRRAKEEGTSHKRLAEKYIKEFKEDLLTLGVDSVTMFPLASQHVDEAIGQVQTLLEKGYAYAANGNIYYDTSRCKDYGKLSHQTKLELMLKRLDIDPVKKSQTDFLLWRSKEDEFPTWPSPFGEGLPGWHIQDTAISIGKLGPRYDIHGGAEELIYPHHEAEIAQAEALTGLKPFVKYWLHTGLLYVDGRKMSKSSGNYVTVREVVKKHGPDPIRLYFASKHYRNPINYSEKSLLNAEKECHMLEEAITRLREAPKDPKGDGDRGFESIERAFYRAMDDDFNTPVALRILVSFAKAVNRMDESSLKKAATPSVFSRFRALAFVLGVSCKPEDTASVEA